MRWPTRSPRDDLDDLCDELGDLLLQVVFHARMARGTGRVRVRRRGRGHHPQDDPPASACVRRRQRQSHTGACEGRLGRGSRPRRRPSARPRKGGSTGCAAPRCWPRSRPGQPALTRAMALQRTASTVGFDWNDPRAVLAKIREEADEIEAALDSGDKDGDGGGDRRPAVRRGQSRAPCRRRSGPGAARHQRKFERRFAYIEHALGVAGRSLSDASLEEMDALWNAAKDAERHEA